MWLCLSLSVSLPLCLCLCLCRARMTGITVAKHIPSGITIGQRILSRLIALCVICGYSTLLGAVLYLVAMKAVWTLGYPSHRLLMFDGVVVSMSSPLHSHSTPTLS